jgi:hypothetical protein
VRYLTLTLAACALAGLFSADPVAAQQPRRPVGNPYLSLTGNPSSVAGAYYGIVRPQLDLRNSVQRLQTQVTRVEVAEATPGSQLLPPTGTHARYMSHGGYFLNSGATLTAPTGPPLVRTGSPLPRR